MSDWLESGLDFITERTAPARELAADVAKAFQDSAVKAKDATLGLNNINDRTLGQKDYDFNYRVFPEDLVSNPQLGHYMIININVPIFSENKLGITHYLGKSGDPRGAFTNASQLSGGDYSKVDVLRFGYGLQGGAGLPSNAMNRAVGTLPRQTKRIKDSIALFMPTGGLTYVTENQYAEMSLTAIGGKLASGALSLGAGLLAKSIGAGGALGSSIGAAAGRLLGEGGIIDTGAKLAGMPINPRIEVLYSHTDLRGFIFQFLFAPKNENESLILEQIIRTLRLHSVPEIDPATFGFTFIPPAEFDFTFYHKGVENVHIPRINTSVLTRVEVEYDPTGAFSTFSNGHPVAVRLALGFHEIEPLHKTRVAQGF